jgi:hypothetical protein
MLLSVFWQPRLILKSEGTIEARQHILYSPASAFVKTANFVEDRSVTAAQDEPLLVLDSPDLNLQRLELVAKQAELRGKKVEAMLENESSEQANLAIELSLVDEKIQSIDNKLRNLTVLVPPGVWTVEGLAPDLIQGRFFPEQEEIIRLNSTELRYFDAIVDQRDVSYLNEGDEALVQLKAHMSDIYKAEVQTISALAKSAGVEQKVLVRMQINNWSNDVSLPPGVSGMAKIYGENLPLWQHITFHIRKFFRADLWL